MVSMSAIRDDSGLRIGRTLDERNSQNPSKYQAKNANITKLRDKKARKKFRHLYYAVLCSCSQLEFKNRLLKRGSSIGGKSVYFEQ